ncbi:hypothetical protein AK830_g3522 [Neonectria ditissima]|uniref:C2H2-type domain-containing protein n=1 Tax=Neonectria ditissima TaxID=78410 RepID=A0A0P7BQ40_9HYPO|nr:hypothetical protein AK830_g3522 [Neonectria ditissima]
MWLVNTVTFNLHQYDPTARNPPYATLSHSSQGQGPNFRDLCNSDSWNLSAISHLPGIDTIFKACSKARTLGLGMLWADSVCVDRSSTADISEAVNSQFQICKNAQVCLVYLSDVNAHETPEDAGEAPDALGNIPNPARYIEHSEWIKGVWMLQELIGSKQLQFYDNRWNYIGSKKSLLPFFSSALRIDAAVLENSECLPDFSIGRRMSWAAQLSASRPEDVAYSLLGIFGVSMTIIYGEGHRAFHRLQEEILRDTNDATLFAWQSTGTQKYRGLLANSPSEFHHFSIHSQSMSLRVPGCIQTSSAGILIDDTFGVHNAGQEIVLCLSGQRSQDGSETGVGIPLREWNNRFVRSTPYLVLNLRELPKGAPRRICISRDVSTRSSAAIALKSPSHLVSLNELALPQSEGSGRKRDANGTPLPDACTSSPRHVNTNDATSVDKNECAALGRYTFSGTVEIDNIDASMASQKSTILLARLVPFKSLRRNQTTDKTSTYQERPRRPYKSRKRPIRESSSSTTVESSGSSNSSELEGEGSEPCSVSFRESPDWDLVRPLASIGEELTQYGINKFLQWVASTEPAASVSAERCSQSPPTRKRIKAECFEKHIDVESCTDSEDAGTIFVHTPGTKSVLSCPFELRRPERYQACLKQGGFSSIRNLLRHLWAAHRLPYYCPICGKVFTESGACDDHIRKNTCDLRADTKVEGVSASQLRRLGRISDPFQSKEKQWYSIWKILFPGADRPLVPHISSKVEKCIRLLRNYWLKDGQDVVSSFLASKDDQTNRSRFNEEDQWILKQKVLNQMVDKLYDEVTSCKNKEQGIGRLGGLENVLRGMAA